VQKVLQPFIVLVYLRLEIGEDTVLDTRETLVAATLDKGERISKLIDQNAPSNIIRAELVSMLHTFIELTQTKKHT
jgi:hypothetical protein